MVPWIAILFIQFITDWHSTGQAEGSYRHCSYIHDPISGHNSDIRTVHIFCQQHDNDTGLNFSNKQDTCVWFRMWHLIVQCTYKSDAVSEPGAYYVLPRYARWICADWVRVQADVAGILKWHPPQAEYVQQVAQLTRWVAGWLVQCTPEVAPVARLLAALAPTPPGLKFLKIFYWHFKSWGNTLFCKTLIHFQRRVLLA